MTSPEKIQELQAIRDAQTGDSGATQCARLLTALRKYPINSYEASRYLDCYYPPARVMTLRRNGYDIPMHWVTVQTEAGKPHRVGTYTLMGET